MKRSSKIFIIPICSIIFAACGAKATDQSFADIEGITDIDFYYIDPSPSDADFRREFNCES